MPLDTQSPIATYSNPSIWNMDDGTSDSKFYKCCVCFGPLSLEDKNRTASTGAQQLLCGNVCARVFGQTVSFVQGFILGRVLCALLDWDHSRIKPLSLTWERKTTAYSVTADHQEKPAVCEDDFISDLPVAFSPASVGPVEEPVSSKDLSHHLAALSRSDGAAESNATSHVKSFKEIDTFPNAFNESKHYKKQKHLKKARNASCHAAENRSTPKLLKTSHCSDEQTKVICFECGKRFSHQSSLNGHCRLKHKKDARPCRVCGKEFYGPAGLSIHMHRVHKDEKPVDCDLCDEKFSSSADRDRHLSLDHGKKHGMCHICGKYFKYSWTLRSHILAHSGIRRFVCEHCGKGFLRSNTLRDHKKLVHFCQGCMKLFSSCTCPDGPKKKIWTQHPKLSKVKNYKKLRCYMCYKTLENMPAYESHMNAHRSERPFGCDECGKRFMHKAGLKSHMYQHKAARFECDVCKKTFTYKCNMEIHKQTHNEGKPYACEFCSKTFKTKATLENHRNRHIEERQYKCHICNKGLAKLHNLKRHLKAMHQYTESN